MKRNLFRTTIIGGMLLAGSCTTGDNNEWTAIDQLDAASVRLDSALLWMKDTTLSPRGLEGNSIRFVKSRDWTSGFFPGILWMMFEYTRDERWREAAHHYSMNIEQEKYNGGTHDMGFKMFCSFGNGYRLTHDPHYKNVLLQSASTLITRFNPRVGCIRSWDHGSDKWDFPVIIDNMMNLELLFWASRVSRDSSYYRVALRHAETTLQNHFREDHSSFHVISYDTMTGKVVKRNTSQGYTHESAWARGQAWGLYGFTMTYRETGDERFLDQSKHIAQFILEHPNLPVDKVPYWDFDAPGQPDIPRDVSAAAIIASALYELSTYCKDEKEKYIDAADQILDALSSDYRLTGKHPFLLGHSVGSFPDDAEVDVPIIYAEYYYLEAQLRKMKLTGKWKGKKSAIILKVDDLRNDPQSVIPERWKRFVTYMENEQVPAAIGLICESLEHGDQAYRDWIIQKYNTGLFEFWNHGYDHSYEKQGEQQYFEFRNRNKEEQREHLLRSQELAIEHLGFELVTFGAPYNQCEQITADVLEEIANIKYWLYPPAEVSTTKYRLDRIPGVGIEYPVHNPLSYHFWNSYYFNSDHDVLVIQGHPQSWDDRRFKEFERIIQYIKALDLEVILPHTIL